MRRANNLTTFMCRLSLNLGASTSWNPQGLSRPVMGLLYLFLPSVSTNHCYVCNWLQTLGQHSAGDVFFHTSPSNVTTPSLSLTHRTYNDDEQNGSLYVGIRCESITCRSPGKSLYHVKASFRVRRYPVVYVLYFCTVVVTNRPVMWKTGTTPFGTGMW